MEREREGRMSLRIHSEVSRPVERRPSRFLANERGASIVEIMIVVLLASFVVLITAQFTQKWIQRESMRSASFLLQTHMQLARTEAITRNRACRFQIDDTTREITVWDLNDPGINSDDILITEIDFPEGVDFALPVSGSAITLNNISGNLYEATFDSNGVVTSGSGYIAIAAGDAYRRVSIYVAGGVGMERWQASSWEMGS